MHRPLDIPLECEFHQLQEIVETGRLAGALEAAMARDGERITVERCRIDQLHYRAGSGCRLCVVATLRRADDIGAVEQVYAGRVYRPGESDRAYAANVERYLERPPIGPPLLRIEDWDLVLWAFPNDPELPGLAILRDAGTVRALFAAAPERFGLPGAPAEVTARLIKYVPERRCGYRYDVTLAANGNGTPAAPRAVYAKAYRGNEGERAFAILDGITRSEAGRRGDVIVPRPYGYDPGAAIVWQAALPGRPILKDRSDPGRLERGAGEIGTRLAALHDCGVRLPLEMTLDFERERVRVAADAIRSAFAAHAARCAAVAQRLLETSERLGPVADVCLHGSFKPSHVLASPAGIAFIDLDGANRGDASSDLGRFVAHVTKMAVTGRIDPLSARRATANFCAAYNRAARHPVPQDRIDWVAACHLIGGAVDKSVKRMDSRSVVDLATAAELLCPA